VLRSSISVAAAALAATCVLAACGPVRMGSAAIVGGQRISATTLGNEVANLEQAYQANKAKIQLQFPLPQAPQQVLAWLLRFRVRDQMAVRNHVKVSNGESARALASIAAQAGPAGIRNLAVANGLPPDLLPALGRYAAIQNALVARLDGGKSPTTPAAQQAIGTELSRRQCEAAKSLDILVNPQFGRLDYAQLAVIPAANNLSAPVSPSPASSTRPALTPPC
jgi:hypothetical protein